MAQEINRIDEFTELEQIKLASFVLNYKKADEYHVNEQKALAANNSILGVVPLRLFLKNLLA